MKRLSILILLFVLILPLAAENRDMIILVNPFSNTGDKKFNWLSAGMADSVINDLMLVKNIKVISEKDRNKSLKEIEFGMSGMVDEQAAVKAGSLLGANVIFSGSYTVVNSNIRVISKLIDVKTGELMKTAKLDGTLDGIFQLQDKIVMTLLSEAEKIEIKDIKPLVVTEADKNAVSDASKNPASVSAYEWYSKGLDVRYTNPRLALEYFEKAIGIDQNYGDALDQAGYIAGDNFSDFGKGLGYLNRAEAIYKKSPGKNSEKYADIMISIGTLYWNKGELDTALKYYFTSRDTYQVLDKKISYGYASAVWGIGLIYYGKQKPDEALKWYNESKSIYDQLDMQNTSTYADLMTNFGSTYYSLIKNDDALVYYQKSKSILDGLGLQNTLAYANALWGIGLIYYEKVDHEKALQNYRDAEQVFTILGMDNSSTFFTFIMNIGIIYERQDKLTEALEYYKRSSDGFKKLGLENTYDYSSLLLNIGIVYQKQKQYDKAMDYFFNSKSLLEKLNVKKSGNYASAMYNIAYVHDLKGEAAQAAEYYRKAAEVYGSIGNAEWQKYAADRAAVLGGGK